jgi:hypothetical protein
MFKLVLMVNSSLLLLDLVGDLDNEGVSLVELRCLAQKIALCTVSFVVGAVCFEWFILAHLYFHGLVWLHGDLPGNLVDRQEDGLVHWFSLENHVDLRRIVEVVRVLLLDDQCGRHGDLRL